MVLKCHADGVPEPELSWEMNEAPLPEDAEGKHYIMLRMYHILSHACIYCSQHFSAV